MEQSPSYVARGRIKSVVSKKLFMTSSRVQGHGLRSSTLSFLTLIFTSITQITLSSFDIQSLAS